ncbi:ThiF family adenylyltransferase [Lysobacter brunescens]|uniref:ThiF family adenylyltransferase n=1 Tax=Lysobacter brunescens TaxID=262323 RepID=A0ABW2Y8F6_9GAMM
MGAGIGDTGLGAALRLLRGRGFIDLPRKGLKRRFEGPLPYRNGSVRIRLEIEDWDFVDYPSIQLLEAPADVPALLPHVNAIGGFCYLAQGSLVLDRYHPEHAIAHCLDRASQELDRLSTDPQYRQGEFQTEFGANWSVGQFPLPWNVFLGSLSPDAKRANAFLIGPSDARLAAVVGRDEEAAQLCQTRGWSPPAPAAATCWIIRSDCMPTLATTGLPCSVGEMFAWIKAWDRRAYGAIQAVLGQREYLAQPKVVFLVKSPAGWFGFGLSLDESKRKVFARKPNLMRQSLHGRGSTRPIERVSVTEFGTDFVHSRNLTFPNLKDRKIVLVGCGAIGSYLAQALVKLGAGSGTGELVLIDSDRLGAENIGRHLLGFESFLMPKVQALEQTLTAQFPQAHVTKQERDALLPADLSGDLIIDATGEEALSEAMNYHRQQLAATDRPPLLHVWVTGNGECVQSLWQDAQKFACYRCLRRNDPPRTPRFDIMPAPKEVRILGCQAFTPFAVSAPMSAAALAIDNVIDWMKGDPSPRFRTRMVESSQARKIRNQDLSPLSDCPACKRP